MDWHQDDEGQRYTLTLGRCQAVVLSIPGSFWLGVVGRAGVSTERSRFRSLDDAQTWCQLRLEQLQAQGRCGKPPTTG